MDLVKGSRHLMLYKDNVDFYIPLDSILFFETSINCISAHTADRVYETTYRLYELEELLPGNYMRVSKSTIINLDHIYSISRNLTSSSAIQLRNTHKQVFVSRHYYNAKIQSDSAVINIDVSFGDVNLYIPRSWNVVNEVHVFLGDMSCSHNNVSSDSPTVVIRGNISFGDTSIMYV